MQDKELYQYILGLDSPWSVANVALNMEDQQIDVHVEHPARTKFCCPECGKSLACYETESISERHRHRYEFNNVYRQQFAAHGMTFAGTSPDGSLVEIVELDDHPWFLAGQFHPEFKSKPTEAHPLFAGFINAAINRHKDRAERAQEVEASEKEHLA